MVSIIAITNNSILILTIYLHTVKWLQVLIFNINYCIEHFSFIYTQLNGSYCYVSLTIQLNISYLFPQLNSQTVLFLIFQFSLSYLFAHSSDVKQVRVDLGVIAVKKNSPFPKVSELEPHHQIVLGYNLGTCWERGFTHLRRCSEHILLSQPTRQVRSRIRWR